MELLRQIFPTKVLHGIVDAARVSALPLALVASVGFAPFAAATAWAQDQAAPAEEAPKPKPVHRKPAVRKPIATPVKPPIKRPPVTAAAAPAAPSHAAAPQAAASPAAGSPPASTQLAAAGAQAQAPLRFAAQLQKAGARTCTPLVEALGAASMTNVSDWNVAANWSVGNADTRAVNLLIGQKFANKALPEGLTSVFAARNGAGGCDAMSMQILPSPLSCQKLREAITANGKALGDLAGVPLLQDANGQVALVPTAADSCVLVAVKIAYPK